MPRRSRTNAPREMTVLVAVILWLIGVADLFLGVLALPNNLGLYALALSGLLMILASIVYGL